MNKIDKILFKYILIAIPFIIVLLIWGASDNPTELSHSKGMTRIFWDTLGWNFMIWTATSLYFTSKMVISKGFREIILTKFTRMKERDERESIIAGEAAKFSFLSTIAILFLFLFLSIFTITIGKYPPEMKFEDGKHGYITMGMSFYPFENKKPQKEIKEDGLQIFNYTGVPLSNSLTIFLIILWQIGSYHLALRREVH